MSLSLFCLKESSVMLQSCVAFKAILTHLYGIRGATKLPIMVNKIVVLLLSLLMKIQAQDLIQEIHFQLFTKANPDVPQILELDDVNLLENSNFDKSLPVKMFAHGLGGSPSASYPSKNGYMKTQNVNFIAVDWSKMAADGDYAYVATNYIPLAGNLTGSYINFLVEQGVPLNSFHLIGHSFGSHVMGFAAQYVKNGKVARISGLDPSHTDEFFPIEDPDSRLDITDAQFVDIIHSEGRFTVPIGHIDFFPNGGLEQPGCEGVGGCCAHCRAVDYFDESIITEVGFVAHECTSWEDYLSGICDNNRAVLMGEYVPIQARGVFYLETNAESPYAKG